MSTTSEALTPEQQARDDFLTGTLPHIVFDGWTQTAMSRAAEDMGVPPVEVKRLFPAGTVDLVETFYTRMDRETQAELDRLDLESMKIRVRIATCVKVRLQLYAQHREAVRRLVTVMSLPEVALKARVKARLFKTADLMWRAAGDTSTDFNYYTKRGLLSAVYGATLLYWLDDESEDFENTWAFLDRRINDVMQIQKLKLSANTLTSLIPENVFANNPFTNGAFAGVSPLSVLERVPERLPGLIPFPIRKPLEWAGQFARNQAQASQAQATAANKEAAS